MISRRALLTAAGVGGAAIAAGPVLSSGVASAAELPTHAGDPETTPRVAGLHLQFGADASREVVVSWHTLQPVKTPQVLLTRLGRPTVDRFRARTVSYVDGTGKTTEGVVSAATISTVPPTLTIGGGTVELTQIQQVLAVT